MKKWRYTNSDEFIGFLDHENIGKHVLFVALHAFLGKLWAKIGFLVMVDKDGHQLRPVQNSEWPYPYS